MISFVIKAKFVWSNGDIIKGKQVVFKFSNKVYKVKTDSKGFAKAKVSSKVSKRLKAGKTYTYSAKYSGFVKKGKVNVLEPVIKMLKDPIVVKKGKSFVVKAKFTWSNGEIVKGKQVVFKFSNKVYKVKTDSKGIAKVTVDGKVSKRLIAGKTYKISAKYSGFVKKGNVKTLGPVVKLVKKSISVKKGQAFTAEAKFTWSNGDLIKGDNVVFNFTKKSYTTKTNSKGIGKVTIKGSETQKLAKGKSYNYSAKCINVVSKGKVTVN